MLAVSKYDQEYIDRVRSRIESDVAAFGELKKPPAGFEQVFFNNMLLALDHYFVHRLRKNEGKDANALKEVRALAASLVEKGDEVKLNADDFTRLSAAFLAEIESRFS
jgi:hypothetical protein